jgi:uncharacterized membrane protein
MKLSFFARRLSIAAALFIFVFGMSGVSRPAFAGLSFCNRTAGAIEAALGYRDDSEDKSQKWISEGWWRIEPGQCARVYAQPLLYRYYFYYGRALTQTSKDTPPTVWSGKYMFCTDDKAFRVEGDSDCAARKLQSTGFQELDLGGKTVDYTLDFKDGKTR